MAIITYEVRTLKEWSKRHLVEVEDWGCQESQALVRLEDGDPKEVIFVDGGEPEDMILCRGLRTFVQLLQEQSATINALRESLAVRTSA